MTPRYLFRMHDMTLPAYEIKSVDALYRPHALPCRLGLVSVPYIGRVCSVIIRSPRLLVCKPSHLA